MTKQLTQDSDIRTMRDAMMGLIGDDVKSVYAETLAARFDDQLARWGRNPAAWPRFVEVARRCGVTFKDACDAGHYVCHLPERVAI